MKEKNGRPHKMDDTYSYFSKKVDPIISPCVANFLFVQPEDVLSALRSYFNNIKAGTSAHSFEDVSCYNPKKSQKLYFAYNFGPIISKIIDSIATFQPVNVVDFICIQLANSEFSNLYGAASSNQNNVEQETKVKSTRNKLSNAINLANSIVSPVAETIEKSKDVATSAAIKHEVPVSIQTNHVSKQTNQATSEAGPTVKNIQITLLGMGGSGKTSIINALQGKFEEKTKPSLGFKPTAMMLGENINVKFYDLGGGPKIRSIWADYYHDIHAIIYVFDSSLTGNELKESVSLFQVTMVHASLCQKPVLIIANKQDKEGSLSSSELSKALDLNSLLSSSVSFIECSSFISKSGSAFHGDSSDTPQDCTVDPRFETGLELFLGNIEKDFGKLNQRVVNDIEKRRLEDVQKRIERERKVLKNKIALAFADQIDPSLLPENLPKANPDDCFGEIDGIAFLAGEIGSTPEELNKVAIDVLRLINYQRLSIQIIGALNSPISKKKLPMSWLEIKNLIIELRTELGLPLEITLVA